MVTVWVIVILIALCGLGACIFIGVDSLDELRNKVIWIVIIAAITLAICGAILFYLYNTESGARLIKDTKSNFGNGINRTVTVYDIDGEIIQQYEGKFDVDYDSERIKFDDENGKRHVIYNKAGTVIIDEK